MKISKVKPVFDRQSIARGYDFWRIRTSREYFKRGAAIFDAPVFDGKVEAVAFLGGNAVWAMFPKGAVSRDDLRVAIEQSGDDTMSFEPAAIGQVPDRELLQLLLNSLAKPRFGASPCSNASGRLLIVNPKHIEKKGKEIAAIHAIEVAVDADMRIALRVKTLSSLGQRKFMKSGRVPIEQLPRYGFPGGRFLRRDFTKGPDDPSAFVERAIGKSKYRVAFLDVSSEDAFGASKVGILEEVLRRLNERYGESVKIEFLELADQDRVECRSIKVPAWRKRVAQALEFTEVKIVDATGEYGDVAGRAADALRDAFGIRVEVVGSVEKGPAYLRLIHEEGACDGEADPHDAFFPGIAVQHLTVEKATGKDDVPLVLLESSLKELVIKTNVLQGKMTLVDWPELGIGGPWSFGVMIPPDNPDDNARYAFMDIDLDGRASYSFEELDFFGEPAHVDLIDAFGTNRAVGFVMKGPDGDVNAVQKTELYTVPEYAEIAACFAEGGKPRRDAASRNRLFADVTDIAFARGEDSIGYYRVGIVGSGMNTSIANASLVREVHAVGGSKLLFPEALCLMDVDFVRMRALSMTPFPLKYLREWVRMNYPAFADAV